MHVAITGASSGIGAALAREYGAAGASLTLVARRKPQLEALAAELPGAHVCVQDLSYAARATDWLVSAEQAHGLIDVLINNAGAQNAGWSSAMDPTVAVRVLELNLLTPIALCRAVAPAMIARGGGTIINVSSVVAFAYPPLLGTYSATKAGLGAFSETLHAELRPRGVHVLTVYPGPVRTSIAEGVYAVFGGRKGVLRLLPEGTTEVLARRVRAAHRRGAARLIYPLPYAVVRLFPWIAQAVVQAAAPLPPPPPR